MSYQKKLTAKATVGEAQMVAASMIQPAIVGARFALIVAVLSFVFSAVALTVAVIR